MIWENISTVRVVRHWTGTQGGGEISILGYVQNLAEQGSQKSDLIFSDFKFHVIFSLLALWDRTHFTISSPGTFHVFSISSFTPCPLQEANEGRQNQAETFSFYYHCFISISSKGVEVTWIGSHTTS